MFRAVLKVRIKGFDELVYVNDGIDNAEKAHDMMDSLVREMIYVGMDVQGFDVDVNQVCNEVPF